MDSLKQLNTMGQSILGLRRAAVAFLFLLFSVDLASAQHLAIRSREKDQHIIHDFSGDEQLFREVRWDIHNSASREGIAVVWTIDAFESRSGKNHFLADAGLGLRIRNAVPGNSWQVTQATDQTNVSKGDRTATVSAICSRHGDATIGVVVVFQTSQTTIPASGEYQTRLVGTITAP